MKQRARYYCGTCGAATFRVVKRDQLPCVKCNGKVYKTKRRAGGQSKGFTSPIFTRVAPRDAREIERFGPLGTIARQWLMERLELERLRSAGDEIVRFQAYEAKDGWRWRAVARNGKIIADGGEAYARKADLDAGLQLMRTCASAPVEWIP